MNLFEAVKNSVTTRQAAERYGLRVGHGGMCRCPFHDDKNPSMKVDKRFHCFGCQADGDVIGFTSRLFGTTARDAALRLASDFGIQYDGQSRPSPVRQNYTISEPELFRHRLSFVFDELVAYRNQLMQWSSQYEPESMDAEIDPRFQEAIVNLATVEYQLDALLTGSDAEKRMIVSDCLREIRRKREETYMEPIVDVPVYHESAAHARKFGELEQYRKSHFANIDCKREIEEAVAAHFDGFRLDRHAIDGVMEKYGPKRVSLVLAATVQVKAWDGRFSKANKDWAFSFDFPDPKNDLGGDRRDSYAVTTHPAILDGFINLVRQAIREREMPREAKPELAVVAAPVKPAKRKAPDMAR